MSKYGEPWYSQPNGWAGPNAPAENGRYYIYFGAGGRHSIRVAENLDAMDAMRIVKCVNLLSGITDETLDCFAFKKAIAEFQATGGDDPQ